MNSRPAPRPFFAYLISGVVFIVLLLYTYAKILGIPFDGLDYNPGEGTVLEILTVDPDSDEILPGDVLVQVGDIPFATYLKDLRQPLFEGVSSGDIVPIRLLRDGREMTVLWKLPPPSSTEIIDRVNTLWLPYIFWFAGSATLFLVRPKDQRWRLLVVFFYLTALWVVTGLVSVGAIWQSAILMRMLIWFCVPVYLHLHWVYPRPLARVPALFFGALYLGAAVMAVLEWFQLLPHESYVAAISLAILGSITLLIAHAILQPDQRTNLGVLAAAFLIIVLPAVTIGAYAASQFDIPLWYGWGALLSLPAIPGAYFYVIYRNQLGGLELRANRIITLYIFLVLLFIFSTLLSFSLNALFETRNMRITAGVAISLVAGFFVATLYPSFQRLIERRLLGMPLPPTYLLETYAARITTSHDKAGLIGLLRDEFLPTLLIRQSALLQISDDKSIDVLYSDGVPEGGLPVKDEIPRLVQQAGTLLPPVPGKDGTDRLAWIRLVLPLVVGDKLIGVWLLGRRDPDDLYAQSEIGVLTAIANQTAIALVNITHADRLHALYQADIERQEQERTNLARGLHDEVLNQLAFLVLRAGDVSVSPEVEKSFNLITTYLRDVISDLRPAMLTYGLQPALDELVDQLSRRGLEETTVRMALPPTSHRYDPKVEQHVFRIVQQACENSIRHANARNVIVLGNLEPDGVFLAVEDDGKGFPGGGGLEMTELLRDGHYGLVGMYERAALIDAELSIESIPHSGTRVSINWTARKEKAGADASSNP